MISTIAVVIAGLSLGIVITTMYRNTPNPVPIIDIERGANGMVEIQTTRGQAPFDPDMSHIECQIEPIAIVDSELNLIV